MRWTILFSLDIGGNKLLRGQEIYPRLWKYKWSKPYLGFLILKITLHTTGTVIFKILQKICGIMLWRETGERRNEGEQKTKIKWTFNERGPTHLLKFGDFSILHCVYVYMSICESVDILLHTYMSLTLD